MATSQWLTVVVRWTRMKNMASKLTCAVHRQFCSTSLNTSHDDDDDNGYLFAIKRDPIFGQQWVAKEDIKAGTILLDELPALISPQWQSTLPNCTPICLTCGHDLSPFEREGNKKRCSSCGWPICGHECEKAAVHANNECKIFTAAKIPFPPPRHFRMSEIGSFIGLIRGGNLRNLNPKLYKDILNLQDYKMSPDCNAKAHNTAQFGCDSLQHFVGHTLQVDTDYQRIHRVCNVNAFTHAQQQGHHTFTLLYPKISLMNHSCSPNCTTDISSTPEFIMRVQTSVDVAADEPLTISYNKNVTLDGTLYRQKQFREIDGPGFTCRCSRCIDPTEKGTMMQAITCFHCRRKDMNLGRTDPKKFGYLLPRDPLSLHPNGEWMCIRCGNIRLTSELTPLWEGIEKNMTMKERKGDARYYESLIKKLSGPTFHPNHWLLQMATRDLLAIMEQNCQTLDKKSFDKQIKLYLYLLDIQNKIMPGINEVRGNLLLKCSVVLTMLLRKFPAEVAESDFELCKQLQEDALACFKEDGTTRFKFIGFEASEMTMTEFLQKQITARETAKLEWEKGKVGSNE